MRMDTDQSFSAYDVVNDYSKEELEKYFLIMVKKNILDLLRVL